MAFKDWFRKKQPSKEPEVTPGGSRQIRHPDPKSSRIGFTEQSTFGFMENREKVYEGMFGPCEGVHHEVLPLVPHIDVYVHKPGFGDRDFYTLATGGMSDLRMKLPQEATAEWWRRTELIFYAREKKEEYLNFLRFLAHFPHDYDTWFGWGHTMPNGDPPEPFFADTQLTAVLFIGSHVQPDITLAEQLVLDGDPVNFLWPVPITAAELEYKLEKGTDALIDVFREVEHPFVFDEKRRSYV